MCYGDTFMLVDVLHTPNSRNSRSPNPANTCMERPCGARNSSQGLTFPLRNNLYSCGVKGLVKSGCHPLCVTFRADQKWVSPHLCDLLTYPCWLNYSFWGDAMAAQWEGRRGLILLYLCPAPSSQNKKLTRFNMILSLNEDKTHCAKIKN